MSVQMKRLGFNLQKTCLFSCLGFMAFILCQWAAPAWAGDKLMNVMGKLTDDKGNPLDGQHVVKFRLYDAQGNPVLDPQIPGPDKSWIEAKVIDFNKGLFNVVLGSSVTLDNIAFNQSFYLGMQVDSDPQEMAPRQPLGASAYALGSLGDFHVKNRFYTGGQALFSNTIYPTPAISFANDTNTGLAYVNNDDLMVITGGVGRMRFDSGGYITMYQKVGIGTPGTMPQQQLQVAGGIVADSYYGLNGTPAWFPKGSQHSEQALFSTTIYPAPAISFNNDANTGLAHVGDDDILVMTGGQVRMRFDSAGYITFSQRVGIGTPGTRPVEQLQVAGRINCMAIDETSDMRFKSNVQGIPSVLDKIKLMRGVTFEWNKTEYEKSTKPQKMTPEEETKWLKTRYVPPEGRHIGVVAQEIEQQFPDLVSTDSNGYKAVSYSRLTVVLLEALKEQQKRIEALEAALAAMKR